MKMNLVSSEVLTCVFKIQSCTNVGTGFILEHKGNNFLITAKHLFEEEGFPKSADIDIEYENGMMKIENKIFYHDDNSVDVAVIKTNFFEGQSFSKVNYTSDDMILSQDVFLLGFPYGFDNKLYDLNNGHPIPIVKKGIISGFDDDIILIDWDNNQGFSGGPVIYRRIEGLGYSDEVNIAGVIVSYISHAIYEDKDKNVISENSGIGIAVKINKVLEIIDNIDIGI